MSATRRVVWAAALLLAAGLAPGCRRRTTYYEPLTIEGLRFFAASELAGDSLAAHVMARNDAAVERRIAGGSAGGTCGDALRLRAYAAGATGRRARGDAPRWDSELWRRATTTRYSQDGYEEVCIESGVWLLAPGDSVRVGTLSVPVRAILGDSLPPGRYRLTVRLNNSAARAGELPAGDVELMRASPSR